MISNRTGNFKKEYFMVLRRKALSWNVKDLTEKLISTTHTLGNFDKFSVSLSLLLL